MFEQLRKIGIVPVCVLDDAKDAAKLAEALCEGGLPCAEVTFRTAAAEDTIRVMAREFPDMLVGAGTVLTREQDAAVRAADDLVDRAVGAGAKFIVAPGLNPDTVSYCIEKGIPIVPGVQTPSEIERGLAFGLNVLKFFPAEPAGGLKMIKAVAAPYTTVSFMPTGGINAANVRDYLAYDRILACGGSWMVKKELINAGDFAKIKELTREAADIVKEVRG